MKRYIVKEEFAISWIDGSDESDWDGIVTEKELIGFARDWGTTVEALMAQVNEYDEVADVEGFSGITELTYTIVDSKPNGDSFEEQFTAPNEDEAIARAIRSWEQLTDSERSRYTHRSGAAFFLIRGTYDAFLESNDLGFPEGDPVIWEADIR